MTRDTTKLSNSRRRFLKSGALGATAALAGCASLTGSGSDKITIGLLQPFTGEVSWVGKSSEKAVNLAIDEINDAGGINGADVELVTEDSEASQQTAVSAQRKLINSDSVTALIGPTSFTLPAVMNIAQQKKVVQISPTAGTSKLDNKGGEYVFRTSTSDSVGGKAMAKLAVDQGVEKMAVMYVDNQGGVSFGQTVAESFEKLGGTVTAEVSFSAGKSSYRSELNKAFADDPEFVSLTAGAQTGSTIINQWHELDLGGVWGLSNDMKTSGFVSDLGQKLEGSYAIAPSHGGSQYETFVEDYKEKTGSEPKPFTPEAYDAMNLVALALAKAGENSRQAVADNLGAVSKPDGTVVSTFADGTDALDAGDAVDYNGASGPVNLDGKGNVRSDFGMFQSTGDAWEQQREIKASELTF